MASKKEKAYQVFRAMALSGLAARQCIILYLVGVKGYTVPQLVRMRVEELMRIDLPGELAEQRLIVVEFLADPSSLAAAFVFPNGKALKWTDFYRIIGTHSERMFGKRLSAKSFHEYVVKSIAC